MSKIQAVEMKYLRAVKGVTKLDRCRNDDIRGELGIESTLKYIERRQLSWWGHVCRMGSSRQPKKVWNTKVVRKKKRGRPDKCWNDRIANIMEKWEISYNDARVLAMNKKEWAQFVHQ